jgi:ribosomal protein S18 acetylase RimI-like enzyme
MGNITYREDVIQSDANRVSEMVTSTGFFNDEEIEIAVELVLERLNEGIKSGYLFLFAEIDNQVVGYSCYGPISGTVDSYDLYWIATDNKYRGQGIGKKLLFETEQRVAALGGNGLYAETASKPQYEPTRLFYEKNNYTIEARLKDFYAPDDDKLIYVKRVRKA